MHDGHFNFHKVVMRHYSGEVENVHTILQQIYSGETTYQILSESPEFRRRYYKKHFDLFSPDILWLSAFSGKQRWVLRQWSDVKYVVAAGLMCSLWMPVVRGCATGFFTVLSCLEFPSVIALVVGVTFVIIACEFRTKTCTVALWINSSFVMAVVATTVAWAIVSHIRMTRYEWSSFSVSCLTLWKSLLLIVYVTHRWRQLSLMHSL